MRISSNKGDSFYCEFHHTLKNQFCYDEKREQTFGNKTMEG